MVSLSAGYFKTNPRKPISLFLAPLLSLSHTPLLPLSHVSLTDSTSLKSTSSDKLPPYRFLSRVLISYPHSLFVSSMKTNTEKVICKKKKSHVIITSLVWGLITIPK